MERVSIFSFKMRSLYVFVFRIRHFKFGQASYCQCSDTHTRTASSFNVTDCMQTYDNSVYDAPQHARRTLRVPRH